MWSVLDRLSAFLIDSAVGSFVLLSILIPFHLFCRQPARRVVLSQTAIVVSMLMVPLSAANSLPRYNPLKWIVDGGGGIAIPISPSARSFGGPVSEPASVTLPVAPTQTGEPAVTSPVAPTQTGEPAVTSPVAPTQTGEPAVTSPVAPAQTGEPEEVTTTVVWGIRIGTIVYLAGVAVGLIWLLVGFCGVRRLVAGSHDPSPESQAIYQAVLAEMATPTIRDAPLLRVSHRVGRPVLAGLLRPTILIPPELDEPPLRPELLSAIFRHELAHAGQGDPQARAMAGVAQSLWFFLPQIHWFAEQSRLDREFLADFETHAGRESSAGYAGQLVDLATATPTRLDPPPPAVTDNPPGHDGRIRSRDSGNSPPPAVATDDPLEPKTCSSPLLQRVAMLLRCPFPIEPRAPAWWSLGIPPVVLVLGILCSSLTVTLASPVPLGWPGQIEAPRAPSGIPFRITQLTIEPQIVTASGRAVPYVIPVLLPAEFELAVEIQADPDRLPHVRLAGFPLAAKPVVPGSTTTAEAKAESNLVEPPWHRVVLRYRAQHLTLKRNGQVLLDQPSPRPPSDWLTIEPAPDRPITLRNLILTP
jgi:beta-lactamase regulating signal transducer with metallopeptidase domain